MKKLTLLTLLITCLGLTFCATPKHAKGFLFEVKSQNGNQKIFIFGTAHKFLSASYVPTNTVKRVFENAEIFVMEGNGANKVDVDYLMYANGENIENHINVPAAQKLDAYLNVLNANEAQKKLIKKMKPITAYSTYAVFLPAIASADRTQIRNEPPVTEGLDSQLLKDAERLKKKTEYLETSYEYIDVWKKSCNTIEKNSALISSLLDMLNIKDQALREAGSVIEPLIEGNFGLFEKKYLLFGADMASEQLYHECSVLPRNLAWMEKITSYVVSGKSAFVAVGAAHLVGGGGLVDLMRKKGFQVTLLPQD